MTIDINKILPKEELFEQIRSFKGKSCQGYRQISPRRGIKLSGCNWSAFGMSTLAELKNSYDWDIVCHEYRMLLKAWKAGLAPKPISVNVLATRLGFVPCLKIQHVNGIMLADTNMSTSDKSLVNLATHARLQRAGIFHNDLHQGNVLVVLKDRTKRWYGLENIKRVYAIDFETTDHVRSISFKETRAATEAELYWVEHLPPAWENSKKFGDKDSWYGPKRTKSKKA